MNQIRCYIPFMMLMFFGMLSVSEATAQKPIWEHEMYLRVVKKLQSLTPGDTITVEMGVEKDWCTERYEIGEPFDVRFRTSTDCFLILMYIGNDGTITFLLPNSTFPTTKIQGKKVYSLRHHFELPIRVSPPPGLDVVNGFCVSEPFTLFDADFDREPFYTIQLDDEERQQQLLERLDQLQSYEWSERSVGIRIGGARIGPGILSRSGVMPPFLCDEKPPNFFPPLETSETP